MKSNERNLWKINKNLWRGQQKETKTCEGDNKKRNEKTCKRDNKKKMKTCERDNKRGEDWNKETKTYKVKKLVYLYKFFYLSRYSHYMQY